MSQNHPEKCACCGETTATAIFHCGDCRKVGAPDSFMEVMRNGDQIEVYCAHCGCWLAIFPVEGTGEPKSPLYPEGTPWARDRVKRARGSGAALPTRH